MRDFDAGGLWLCRYQGELFEQSPVLAGCSSAIFARRFMNSDVARRLDSGYFAFEASDTEGIFAEIERQYGPSRYGTERYGDEELYWMGYLYRYWAYVYEMSSMRIYKAIGARELRGLYPAYHTLDPAAAIERIAEAKGVLLRSRTFEEQVELLRQIRARNREKYPDPSPLSQFYS